MEEQAHQLAGAAPADMPKPLSTKANMLFNSVGSITFLGCQWLITILVVRLAGSFSPAGVLSLAMSIYNIFAPLAKYRLYTYQVSDIKRENTVGEYFAFRIATCAMALVALVVYAAITSPLSAMPAVVLYALYKLGALSLDTLHGQNQLFGRMDYNGISLALQGVGTLAAFSVTLFFTGSLEASIVAMAAITAVIGVVYDLPRTRRFGPIKIKITRRKAVALFVRCLPIVLASIAAAAVPSIPRQYLMAVSGPDALGIYASVAAPVAIIQMGASYIYNPLLSNFARYYEARDMRSFGSLFAKAALGIVALGIVCAILLKLFGGWLLSLMYGERILAHLYLLMPVIACTLVNGLLWFTNDLLVAIRCFSGSFAGSIVSLIAALPATYFCVSMWDMNGVSFSNIIAYAVSLAVMAAFLAVQIRRKSHEA